MHGQIAILVLSFLLTVGQCLSQRLELELMARPAMTSLRGIDFAKDNLDPSFNFSTGVGLDFFIRSNSLINFGILYDKKGGRGESIIILRDPQGQVTGEATLTNEVNFDYITIPIQWGQRFGKKIKYQYGLGLYTSFILKQELIDNLDGLVNFKEENTDTYKTLDFGLSASFNMYIPFNDKFSIKVGLDDNLGLINVSDVPISGNETIKHNSLGLTIGLNYRVN